MRTETVHSEADLKIHLERRHQETQDQDIETKKEQTEEVKEKVYQALFGKSEQKKVGVVGLLTVEMVLENSGQESLDDVTDV